VTFLLIKFKGPLHSISASWYELGYPLRNLFVAFCFSIGFTMTLQTGSILFFLSGLGLAFVGIASWSQSLVKLTRFIHFAGAVSGIVFGLLGIGFGFDNWIPLLIWIILSLLILLFKIRNRWWWIEIVAFITIIIGLYNQ
jgi:hypothetical protein